MAETYYDMTGSSRLLFQGTATGTIVAAAEKRPDTESGPPDRRQGTGLQGRRCPPHVARLMSPRLMSPRVHAGATSRTAQIAAVVGECAVRNVFLPGFAGNRVADCTLTLEHLNLCSPRRRSAPHRRRSPPGPNHHPARITTRPESPLDATLHPPHVARLSPPPPAPATRRGTGPCGRPGWTPPVPACPPRRRGHRRRRRPGPGQ